MELYTGTVPTVEFEYPTASGTVVSAVTYSINGATAVATTPTNTSGKATATLPYLQTEGTVSVTWTFTISNQSYTDTQTYEIVTPILKFDEIASILNPLDPVTSPTDNDQVKAVESAVRHIINVSCGQSFGKQLSVSKSVTGEGRPSLALPMRLINLISIDGNIEWPMQVNVLGDGWFIQFKNRGIPTIRSDFEGFHYDPSNQAYSSDAPIYAPRAYRHYHFLTNRNYTVTGDWGWLSVPNAVREAAKLLINDYACGDAMYRDRFLNAIQAADWQLEFNPGAFRGTGNVRADQLLEPYVIRRGWLVV